MRSRVSSSVRVGVFGHLFSGRYKSLIVDGSGSGYLKTVCDDVHLNPARAKSVGAEQPLKSFVRSSWPAYLLEPSKGPVWLWVDRMLGEWGIHKDSPAGRQQLEQALEARRGRRRAGSSRRSSADGVWAKRRFGRNCWRR
jgi:hypothetical protein